MPPNAPATLRPSFRLSQSLSAKDYPEQFVDLIALTLFGDIRHVPAFSCHHINYSPDSRLGQSIPKSCESSFLACANGECAGIVNIDGKYQLLTSNATYRRRFGLVQCRDPRGNETSAFYHLHQGSHHQAIESNAWSAGVRVYAI